MFLYQLCFSLWSPDGEPPREPSFEKKTPGKKGGQQ